MTVAESMETLRQQQLQQQQPPQQPPGTGYPPAKRAGEDFRWYYSLLIGFIYIIVLYCSSCLGYNSALTSLAISLPNCTLFYLFAHRSLSRLLLNRYQANCMGCENELHANLG